VSEPPRSWRLGFWSLIATQFQGAFNDNALKFLVLYLTLQTNLSPDEEASKVRMVGLLFAAPFILFSMTGGFLADRFSKRSVTIGTKYFEIAVMLLAIAAFWLHSMPVSLVALFLASTQGALFGPSKYGPSPNSCRRRVFPGATASSNWAPFSPPSPEPLQALISPSGSSGASNIPVLCSWVCPSSAC